MASKRAALTVGAALTFLVSGTALAGTYGGWDSLYIASYGGVKGYIKQPTGANTPSGAELAWLGLCKHGCTEWVQTGTYQGVWNGGDSPNAVHMFYENTDLCGEYFAQDIGAPPASDYNFSIKYDGTGSHTFRCATGPKVGYTFNFTKGASSTPYYYGPMSVSSGEVEVSTEIHPGGQITYNFFGCDPGLTCGDSTYGMYLYTSSWHIWDASFTTPHVEHDNPPFLHTYHSYWSFKTCPVAC